MYCEHNAGSACGCGPCTFIRTQTGFEHAEGCPYGEPDPEPNPDLLTPEQAASFLHMTEAELAITWTMGKGPELTMVNDRPRFKLLDLINWQLLRHDQTEGE